MPRLLFATTLLFSACASTAPKEPTEPARGHMASTDARNIPDPNPKRITHPQDDLTCKDETPTGTMLDRRKCRSDMERQQDHKVVEDLILDPSSRPMTEKN